MTSNAVAYQLFDVSIFTFPWQGEGKTLNIYIPSSRHVCYWALCLTIFSVFPSQGHGKMKLDVVAMVLLMSLSMLHFHFSWAHQVVLPDSFGNRLEMWREYKKNTLVDTTSGCTTHQLKIGTSCKGGIWLGGKYIVRYYVSPDTTLSFRVICVPNFVTSEIVIFSDPPRAIYRG